MLRIFRKLKRKLITDSKVTHYFLYALGEIVLIVVGILLALGINNWSEENKLRVKEQFYLTGLKDEFKTSKAKLEVLIEVNRSNYQNAGKIAGYFSSDSLPDEKELSKLLYKAFSYDVVYNPNNSLLDEILNSGGFNTITNPELRRHLTDWESRVLRVNSQELALINERNQVIDVSKEIGSIRAIITKSGVAQEIGLNLQKDSTSNVSLLKSKQFENNLLIFILSSMATEEAHYMPLMEEISHILELIEGELK